MSLIISTQKIIKATMPAVCKSNLSVDFTDMPTIIVTKISMLKITQSFFFFLHCLTRCFILAFCQVELHVTVSEFFVPPLGYSSWNRCKRLVALERETASQYTDFVHHNLQRTAVLCSLLKTEVLEKTRR